MHFSRLRWTSARRSACGLDPPKAAFHYLPEASEIKQDFLPIASFGIF
jgi:hypothetical protein